MGMDELPAELQCLVAEHAVHDGRLVDMCAASVLGAPARDVAERRFLSVLRGLREADRLWLDGSTAEKLFLALRSKGE
jgi:uncharacterized radical SAM superfamily Fe-S cluster-containing enzyme